MTDMRATRAKPQSGIQEFTEWLATMSLAQRYRARLDTLFVSYSDETASPLVTLRQFVEQYVRELRVSLMCAGSALWYVSVNMNECSPDRRYLYRVGLDCHALYGRSHMSTTLAESLTHPIPRTLWALSMFYAVLSIALYLALSKELCTAVASGTHAVIWLEVGRLHEVPAKYVWLTPFMLGVKTDETPRALQTLPYTVTTAALGSVVRVDK